MKIGDGERQFGVEDLQLNCVVVYLSMGVNIAHATNFTEHKKILSSYNMLFVINYFHMKVAVSQY